MVGAEFVIYTVQWKTDVSVERINLVLNSLEIACSVINQWRIRWCQESTETAQSNLLVRFGTNDNVTNAIVLI